jgi:hypothetical protein
MSLPQSPAAPGRAPILECVREGFAFIARDWRGIAPLAALAALLLAPVSVWSEMAAARGDVLGNLLGSVLSVAVQAPFLTALLRRALSRGVEPLSLKLGAEEFRVMGVIYSIMFFFVIVAVVLLLVLGLAIGGLLAGSGITAEELQGLEQADALAKLNEALGAEGALIFWSVLALSALGLLWLSARLSLAAPATVAEGRALAFSTWSWTKGNAAPIAACLVLLALGGMALAILALMAPVLAVQMAFGESAATTPGSPGHWLLSWLQNFGAQMFLNAPYAGMIAYLYRGLRPA